MKTLSFMYNNSLKGDMVLYPALWKLLENLWIVSCIYKILLGRFHFLVNDQGWTNRVEEEEKEKLGKWKHLVDWSGQYTRSNCLEWPAERNVVNNVTLCIMNQGEIVFVDTSVSLLRSQAEYKQEFQCLIRNILPQEHIFLAAIAAL